MQTVIIAIAFFLSGHTCKWSLCPYKGVTKINYVKCVEEYTGEEFGSDAVAVDCLHILRPDLDADTLNEMVEND